MLLFSFRVPCCKNSLLRHSLFSIVENTLFASLCFVLSIFVNDSIIQGVPADTTSYIKDFSCSTLCGIPSYRLSVVLVTYFYTIDKDSRGLAAGIEPAPPLARRTTLFLNQSP